MIEINRKDSPYIFRINPYAPHEIDRRENRHRARWERHSVHDSAEAARAALLQIDQGADATQELPAVKNGT